MENIQLGLCTLTPDPALILSHLPVKGELRVSFLGLKTGFIFTLNLSAAASSRGADLHCPVL